MSITFFFLPFLPHLSIYLFLKKLFLLGRSLLYNTVLVSAIHQHDIKQVASGNLLFDTGSSNLRQPGAVGWGERWEAGSRIVLLSCWKVGSGIHLWRGRRSCQGVDWCRGPDAELASNVALGTTSLTFLRSTFLRNKSNSASSGAARTSQGVPARMLCKLKCHPGVKDQGGAARWLLPSETCVYSLTSQGYLLVCSVSWKCTQVWRTREGQHAGSFPMRPAYTLFVSVIDILACFRLSAGVKNAAMNVCTHDCLCPCLQSLGFVLHSGVADPAVFLFLMFWGAVALFSTAADHLTVPLARRKDPNFSTSLQVLAFCCLFLDNSHSTGYEGVSHFGFVLHFPNDLRCWTHFYILVAICIFSLQKFLFKFFAHLNMTFLMSIRTYLFC